MIVISFEVIESSFNTWLHVIKAGNKRLLFSVHMYAPYDFAMNPNMTLNEFTLEYRAELYEKFSSLYKKYTTQGYYVVVGEMGVVNKNNTIARTQWGKYYLEDISTEVN